MENEQNKVYQDETVISFGDMWHHFIDHISSVIIIVLIGCLLGLFIGVSKGKTYTASGTLLVNKGSQEASINTKKEIMEVINNDEVINMVCEELSIEKKDLVGSFSLTTDEKAVKITVSYIASNDNKAVEIVNSFMKNSIEFLNKKDGDNFIYPSMAESTTLFTEASSVTVTSQNKKMLAIGLLLGLMVGGIYVVVITTKDDHFKSREEVERLNIPLLGEVKSYIEKEDK